MEGWGDASCNWMIMELNIIIIRIVSGFRTLSILVFSFRCVINICFLCCDCRLLAIFCVINLLNYVDRGAIASNGVNGSLRTCTDSGVCSGGTGIQ